MSESAAISILENYNIQYEIEYVENGEEVVLYQSYKEGTKVKNIKKIKLKIGKITDKSSSNEHDSKDTENLKEDNIDVDN